MVVLRNYYALVPAAATLTITGFGMTSTQLWRDEMATWSAATRSPGELFDLVRNIDAVSGAYYLFMHYWIAVFGDSALALRLPSVLCMTGAAALVGMIGKRLFEAPVGLLAGLLFAIIPGISRYGQEARSYAFATFFAVLATYLLIRALEAPSWLRWIGYAAAVTATGLSHLIAVTVVAGHAIFALLPWRRASWYWLASVGAAGLLLLPLAIEGSTQHSQQLEWVATPSVGDLLTVPRLVFRSALLAGITIGLAALGWAAHARRGAALAACAALPVIILWSAGQATQVWVPRYLTFTLPFLCVLGGAALATTRLRGALVVLAAFLAISGPDQRAIRESRDARGPLDYAAAADIVEGRQQPGDTIVYAPRGGWRFLDTGMDYHLRDGPRPRDVLLRQSRTESGSLWATDCDRPAECLAGVERVWVVALGEQKDPLRPMERHKAAALRQAYLVAQTWTVPGLTVALLTQTPPLP
ncbi:glycosyltransferase family 39 protein [Actinomycetes bacterium KLBMP 9797]